MWPTRRSPSNCTSAVRRFWPCAAFAKDGVAAVTGIRRRNRQGSVLTPELEKRILDTTLQTRRGDGSTHRSVRTLARSLRVSRTIVHRVWQRHDVQPHRVERFKLSNDPRFEEKVRDIVGLYLNPQIALWCCVWTGRARSKRWTAPRRFFPCGRACPNGKPTTTIGTAPQRCSRRSAKSSVPARNAIAAASSSAS